MLPDLVQQKLDSLPAQPGVYLFKDKKGTVVYVGKAKSFRRSRVRSYFQAGQGDTRPFIPILLRTIGDLETLVAAGEKEAAILENNLIKEHRPRYNVKLRDDKDFITLRLRLGRGSARSSRCCGDATRGSPTRMALRQGAAAELRRPRPSLRTGRARRIVAPPREQRSAGQKKARKKPRRRKKPVPLLRPLPLGHRGAPHAPPRQQALPAPDVQPTLELVSRRRPCLQHQIKRCPAPCVLPGRPDVLCRSAGRRRGAVPGGPSRRAVRATSRVKMKDAARAMRFELAAVYRDQLPGATRRSARSSAAVTVDAVPTATCSGSPGGRVEISILHVRGST